MAIPITITELSDSIRAATVVVNEKERQIAVSLWDLLADGHPVSPRALAARARVDQAAVDSALERWPGIFRNEENLVVGFWGLAIPPMAHRFHAEGGKPIHAWCALDPFLIVPVIGRAARVESKDPISGERIAMTVTPDEITDASPASVVVSFLVPDKPFDQEVIQSFCNFVHFFAGTQTAEQWAQGRDEIVIFPVQEAFEVGRRAWRKFRDPAASL
ncbi:MAG TPA: organomercurial lyase [Methylomirabilota bacterium]|nr:organomercurial lyase [Methylomirabilota bacterium]